MADRQQGHYESHLHMGRPLLPFIHRRDTIGKGSDFQPHWHENLELLHCTEGAGTVILNGMSHPLRPGSVAVVNPHVIHRVIGEPSVTYECLILFDSFCRENGLDTDKAFFDPILESPALEQLYETMYESLDRPALPSPLQVRHHALALLYHLDRHHRITPAADAPALAGIKAVINHTNRFYDRPISLQQMALLAGMSKYYFTKKFKEATGYTYVSFLNSVRCRNAAELLSHGKTATEVCFAVGYADPAYFSRVFKHSMGVPPSKYAGIKA